MKTTSSLPGQALRAIKPRMWQRYRDLPVLGCIADDYVRWTLKRGFAVHTISIHLDALRRHVPWFLRRHKRSVADLSSEDLIEVRRFYQRRKPWLCPAIRWLGDMLQERGQLKRKRPVSVLPSELEITRFATHLRADWGLKKQTISHHSYYVRRFLLFLGFDRGNVHWRDLKLPKIEEFVCRMSRRLSREVMAGLIGTLRKFLRFQFQMGTLHEPLHLRLGSVRIYREERLPHPLPWAELQKLLHLMDHSTPQGRRDFAILLLAASYGLRCSEVSQLRLDDIDWRLRTVCLAQPKTGQKLMLPLTDEVAEALVDYLQRGRPATTCRRLFVRVRPPSGTLGIHGVGCCLARAIRATGVNIQTHRFHALRHAFALRLLLEGTPLKHISEVLGHRSFNSTSAYLCLDVEDLRQVALQVPKTLDAAECRKFGRCRKPNESRPERKNRWPGSVTVSATLGFRSFLGRPMRDFLRLRRALGRSSYSDGWILRSLDFFLARHHVKGRVFTGAMFDQWAAEQLHLSPTTRCSRMHFIRNFCQYLLRTAPTTFVPDPRKFPKKRPPFAPCLLSPKDVARILAATHRPKALFSPEHPLRPKTMHLAVLLLYCCGLRRSEAVHLTLGDVDTQEQVLRIRHSKFHKSRLVPVSPSVNDELRKYLQQRHNHKTPTEPSSPLLWSGQAGGRADGGFSGGGLHWNWQQICRYAGVFNQRGVPPRVHDLRHSFAVTVLQRAYHAGRDPQVTLPRLARYMGHVDFQFTHHYLKFTEPLRHAASERFHRLLADILVSSSSPKSTKGFTNE